jgi:hypothetical protein
MLTCTLLHAPPPHPQIITSNQKVNTTAHNTPKVASSGQRAMLDVAHARAVGNSTAGMNPQ